MNQAVFTWRKPCCKVGKVTYEDRHSTFNKNVRDAIRRGAAENEVPKHEEKLTGVWVRAHSGDDMKSGVKATT